MADECCVISLGQIRKYRIQQGLHFFDDLYFIRVQKAFADRAFIKVIIVKEEMKNLIDF